MKISKKREILDRRKNVAQLIPTHSISEIAKILNYKERTIKRDIRYVKEEARVWLYDLPKESFILDYKSILDRCRKRTVNLEKNFFESNDVWEKIGLSKEIRDTDRFLMDLYDRGSTVYMLRKVIGNAQQN
ncbi:MAG: hypothetical protein ABI340_03185 [Nitrososphaera sp.]|jgi:hypothetical protein